MKIVYSLVVYGKKAGLTPGVNVLNVNVLVFLTLFSKVMVIKI